MPSSAMIEFTGRRLGGYLLEKEIGRGTRGIIYRGTQVSLGREVAIKVFPLQCSHDPDAIARFVREVQILARLNHPNLVRIYDAGEQDGVLYFVMEYVPGPTIRSLLTLDGRLPPHLAVEYTAQAAEALDMAYQEAHVIHRNLTPANLVLDWWGYIRVMDFGLACVPGLPPVTAVSIPFTNLVYASPEHLQGYPLDHRSDVYALGVILYEMLTGSPPFVGRTPQEMIQTILAGSPYFPPHLISTLPPALPHIITTALAANRDRRFAEAGTMAKALRALRLSASSTSASSPEVFQGTRVGVAERRSDILPKPFTMPIRDPYTPLPGLLSHQATAFYEKEEYTTLLAPPI